MNGTGRFGADYQARLDAAKQRKAHQARLRSIEAAKQKREQAFSSSPPKEKTKNIFENASLRTGIPAKGSLLSDIQEESWDALSHPESSLRGIAKKALVSSPFGVGISVVTNGWKDTAKTLFNIPTDIDTQRGMALLGGVTGGEGKGASYSGRVAERAAESRLARGAFEKARYGLSPIAEIVTGNPEEIGTIIKRYPWLAQAAQSGFPSFRGIDILPETQVPFVATTAKGGVKRAQAWLDIPFPQLGELVGMPEASVNTISRITRGRGIDFGDMTPKVESVKRMLDTRRADLGDLQSTFGFIYDPTTTALKRNITAPKEHIVSAAYTGADIASHTLKAAQETHSLDDIAEVLTKLEKGGRKALSPDELLYIDEFFNSRIKGAGPYDMAREQALKLKDPNLLAQYGEGAATNAAYYNFLHDLGKTSETLVDPFRNLTFATDIKPLVRFGSSTFGTTKKAVDVTQQRAGDFRRDLANALLNLF